LVTSVMPSPLACAAMNRSLAPIIAPRFFRSARISLYYGVTDLAGTRTRLRRSQSSPRSRRVLWPSRWTWRRPISHAVRARPCSG
jgi:hypothetical protein